MTDIANKTTLPKVPRRRNWALVLLIGVIFLSGAVAGGSASAIALARRRGPVEGPTREIVDRMIRRLQDDLGLTDDQTGKIRTILIAQHAQLQVLREETRQQAAAIFDDTRSQVAGILTPAQAAAWKDVFENRREPWRPKHGRQWRPRRGPGRRGEGPGGREPFGPGRMPPPPDDSPPPNGLQDPGA